MPGRIAETSIVSLALCASVTAHSSAAEATAVRRNVRNADDEGCARRAVPRGAGRVAASWKMRRILRDLKRRGNMHRRCGWIPVLWRRPAWHVTRVAAKALASTCRALPEQCL